MKGALNPKILDGLEFKLVEQSPFENYQMPYYVKNCVCLFFNELPKDITEIIGHSYLIGFAEMQMGKYYAVTFRWIKTVNELHDIYKTLTNKSL